MADDDKRSPAEKSQWIREDLYRACGRLNAMQTALDRLPDNAEIKSDRDAQSAIVDKLVAQIT